MLSNTLAVTDRVFRQLRRDRRFIILTLIVPVVTVFMLYFFFEGVEVPAWSPFDPQTFVVPMGAFLVHFLTYILSAIVLVRERSQETLSRMFINGYRQIEIIAGYILAYSVLATLQSLITLIALQLAFGLEYPVDVLLLIYVVVWLLAIISIALGIFVSNFARNEGQVFPMIPPMILMSAFFSGIIVPVEKLPEWLNWLSAITPLYYANNSIQQLIAETPVLNDALPGMLLLPVYGVVVLLLATVTLKEGA